jgi:hypothetical protein
MVSRWAVPILGEDTGEWKPQAVVRLEMTDHRVTSIRDYLHCPWILPAAVSVAVDSSWPN